MTRCSPEGERWHVVRLEAVAAQLLAANWADLTRAEGPAGSLRRRQRAPYRHCCRLRNGAHGNRRDSAACNPGRAKPAQQEPHLGTRPLRLYRRKRLLQRHTRCSPSKERGRATVYRQGASSGASGDAPSRNATDCKSLRALGHNGLLPVCGFARLFGPAAGSLG